MIVAVRLTRLLVGVREVGIQKDQYPRLPFVIRSAPLS